MPKSASEKEMLIGWNRKRNLLKKKKEKKNWKRKKSRKTDWKREKKDWFKKKYWFKKSEGDLLKKKEKND